MESTDSLGIGSAKVFATTRWSVIAACSDDDQSRSKAALSELCQSYWQPIYTCIRHHGHPVHDAQDLTQEFFVHLLKGKWTKDLDSAKGRFRSYLSVALRHFLVSRHRRRWTLWSGRGPALVPLDADGAEGHYQQALKSEDSPEDLYERQWAVTVIEQALGQLRVEMQADGKEMLYEHFDAILEGTSRRIGYADLAQSVGMTVGGVHTSLHRWRRRFYNLLRDEVARTVVSKSEIDAELDHLFRLIHR